MTETLVLPGTPFIRDPQDRRIRRRPTAPVALIGVPWDWSTAGRPGARFAPARVRDYLYSLTTYSPCTGSELPVDIDDLGDVRVAPGDPDLTALRVAEVVRVLTGYDMVVVLGGDHTVTGWVTRALLDTGIVKRLCMLVLDAHYDLRSVEEGLTSGSWLYDLLTRARDRVKAVVVGVAEYANPPYLARRARELGVRVVPALKLARDPAPALSLVDELAGEGCDAYYISVDMDHLSAAYAPGVNSPTPVGLDPRTSLTVLEYAARRLKPRYLDFTEVAPPYDVNDLTSRLTAFLLAYTLHARFGGRGCLTPT